MASLNLIDWRHPPLTQELRRHRRLFFGITLVTIVAASGYYQYARQPIQRLDAQIIEHDHALKDFSDVEATYRSEQQKHENEQLDRQAQQQYGQAVRHFMTLLQLREEGLQLDSVSWLPNELNVIGQYQHVDAVKTLQQQLQALVPEMHADIRFPRHKQFMIVLSANVSS